MNKKDPKVQVWESKPRSEYPGVVAEDSAVNVSWDPVVTQPRDMASVTQLVATSSSSQVAPKVNVPKMTEFHQ